jgi:endogenous inhibitor of DNA gyrase (YacG/DUF329 family)
MDELLAFIASVAMQHCPTCRAVFVPARTGMPFCSRECQHLDPRAHRFEVVRRENERAAALKPPSLPWDEREAAPG